ncbi:uncharacterized protein BDZ99DRAFT_507974 [Mytilinidion resinicola]|uniref:Zn(2)-C6 fungal-type domain-containing protein n=1 Tax=Mytilinidion resinicola TaxID=574789 RepID=A0A6A6YU78_9PEZI|nr:uncharacterized protein BDZ99DRAFT_507974 [Mytilinidion resinicola]KAF2811584.1 hypothetical protein BDZ99DRAFT_507974 [Mytilinidion resinicola]
MISSAPESTPKAPRYRRRSTRSCQECRRRKVKCDRKEPCSHCVLSKTTCVYTPGPVRTAAHTRESNISPTSSSRGINTILQLESRPLPIPLNTRGSSGNGGNPSLAQPLDPALNEIHEPNELNHRPRPLEQSFSSAATDSATETPLVSPPPGTSSFRNVVHSPQKKQFALNKSRLFGQTHWTNAAHEFKRIGAFLSSESGNSTDDEVVRCLKAEIRASLQKCKLLAKSMKTTRPSRCFSCPAPIFSATERDLADQTVHLYISRFESAFRILHIPSFRTEYEQYWRNPTEAASALQFKVQLVIAIGSSLHREACENPKVRSAACQWVYAAQNWLSGPMEKDRLSISGLQVQCLLFLARQTLAISGDLTWIAIGTLVHTAMQMGLHRDPKHFVKLSILQGEVRRRLWATIMEMNVQASLDSGVPPTLSFDDFDTDPPSNVDDTDIDECTRVLGQRPEITITDTSLQRSLFGCLRPRLDILRRMNGFCSETPYDEILALSSVINSACRECSTRVKRDNEAEGTVFKQNLGDLFIRRFLLALHRPFASRARTNPTFYFSRKTSLDAATALLSPTLDEEFSRLVTLGSGIFKSRIIHASLALTSELLIEAEEPGASSTTQCLLPNYRKMLVDAVKEARRQLAQRMQFGETNVRLHMKLSIALSQAECTESGASLQQHMAQSAKDSLQMSYAMIQARSGPPLEWSRLDENIFTPGEDDFQGFADGFQFHDILGTADIVMDEAFGPGLPFC